METIDYSTYLARLAQSRKPWHEKYYAMYSSMLRAVVLDPLLMQVPIDDHLVHRGDGVFDTFKCIQRGAYNLDAHLQRLMRSATSINLSWPGGIDELRQLTLETLMIANRDTCAGRVIIARGPGSFSVNPYESPNPALYIVIYALGAPFMEAHPEGAHVMRSQIPIKPAQFATVKNCNYLPNVLMKREAVTWGVDFVVGFDENGYLAEGATENFGLVTRDGALCFPTIERVLEGTTMLRVMELAKTLVKNGALQKIMFKNITEADVCDAKELLIVGTTMNVVSVCKYEKTLIGDGNPGDVGKALNALLVQDIALNPSLRTNY